MHFSLNSLFLVGGIFFPKYAEVYLIYTTMRKYSSSYALALVLLLHFVKP